MKTQMSNFDVAAFVKEAKSLVGMKMAKAFQPDYSTIWLRFQSKGRKATLVINIGQSIWFEDGFLSTGAPPPHFAMLLRKHLANRTLIDIKQHNFDRIVLLDFSGEGHELALVIELFSRGNAILVENDKIIQPLTSKSWRHRDVKSGSPFEFPPEGVNPLNLTGGEIEEILRSSDRDLVRTLATKLNLGGSYAEEVCQVMLTDKNKPSSELADPEVFAIQQIIQRLINLLADDFKPIVKLDDGEATGGSATDGSAATGGSATDGSAATDVLPFSLIEGGQTREFETFNLALKEYFSNLPDITVTKTSQSSELARLERQAEQQRSAIDELEVEAGELQKKGDVIYASYAEVEAILGKAMKVLEENDWPAAKAEVEGWENVGLLEPKKGRLEVTLVDGTPLVLDVRKDVNENASAQYDLHKKKKERLEGARLALGETLVLIRGIEDFMGEEAASIPKKPTKQFWFETYRWFVSSEGFLVIGGKDMKTNDKIVKKQLKDGDLYAHAEIRGAPSIVIKDGRNAGQQTLEEACEFALCHSKAWNAKLASGSAYWVKPDQVSKTPQPGEFLPKGAFVIRGKRNFSKKLDVKLAVGEIRFELERKIMCGPVSALQSLTNEFFIITPGELDKNEFAKRLSDHYNVPNEEILRILPPGDLKITREP